MTYGLTPEGFVAKPQSAIIADFQAASRSDIDPQIEYSDEDPLGQIFGIASGPLAELWEQAQEIYFSIDRENAEGDALDNVGSLSGTTRGEASKSVVYCTMDLDNAAVVPAGAIIAVDGQEDIRFTLETEQTGTGTPLEDVKFLGEVVGPIQAAAGSLTVIVTPYSGWNSVTNPLDAAAGDDVETLPSYRRSIALGTARRGGSTLDAIRADVLALNDTLQGSPIIAVSPFENTGLVTDANGLPGKSIEILVHDGAAVDNDVIAQAIWDSKPGGIQTFGNANGTAIDKKGNSRTVYFSRPTPVSITVVLSCQIDPGKYIGDVALKLAIVTAGKAQYDQGDDVLLDYLRAVAIINTGVKVISDMTANGEAERVPILVREIADWDTIDVTVTTTPYIDV